MTWGQRKSTRITFANGYVVQMVGIDGTWQRTCTLLDISSTGARLRVEGAIEGLNLKEFFLMLTPTGLAFRRCELIRVNGDEIGVHFLQPKTDHKERGPAASHAN